MREANLTSTSRALLRPVPRTDPVAGPLAAALRHRFPGVRMETLRRRPAPRRSSWWLENLSVTLHDGSTVEMVLKTPGREVPGSGARALKPARVSVPWREEWVYRELFRGAPSGPPACYGVVRSDVGRSCLLLERIDGAPLAEVEGGPSWLGAAQWLGRFHARSWNVRGGDPLILHDRALHRWWFERAVRSSAEGSSHEAGRLAGTLADLEPVHAKALRVLDDGSPTVLHGEFHPCNVLVESAWGRVRIRPVDWEMAGLGPPLMDLAALTAGSWSEDRRVEMAMAYRHGALAAGAECPPLDRFLWNLDACGLLLAVQWLGWARGWTPPAEHRTDWLGEAVRCAEGVESCVG